MEDKKTAARACVGKYAVFAGRTARAEYWWFILFLTVVHLWFVCVEIVSTGTLARTVLFALHLAVALVLALPALSATVRRLHDAGWSGWLVLLGLVPGVGTAALIVLLCMRSEPRANRHGPVPQIGDSALVEVFA